ncbi:MAG TPA: hypothetical protein VJ161_01425 [Geobacteraceae bacterium]|nr:hypothetical protein [Geobacteraceae bacterium]
MLQADTPREEKLKASRGEIRLDPSDLVAVLLYLSRGQDGELRNFSLGSMKALGEDILTAVCSRPDTQPLILDTLARVHFENPRVAFQAAMHPNVNRSTLTFLAERGVEAAQLLLEAEEQEKLDAEAAKMQKKTADSSTRSVSSEKDGMESKSKYQQTQELGIPQRIKFALTGDKEWRSLLIRDNNKVVSRSVLKNPRITEQEVLVICKSSVKNDEILRLICTNKEWTKSHQIRKALIENHKTPLHYSLRFLTFFSDKELSFLARSKNVSSVIVTQARRMLVNRKSGK